MSYSSPYHSPLLENTSMAKQFDSLSQKLIDFIELPKWAENKGKEGIKEYWAEKNVKSMDGYPTNIFGEE